MTDTREIAVTEDEAWRIFLLMEEMVRFLHQEGNYRTIQDLNRWLEDRGIFKELADVFYETVAPWFPVDEETGYVVGPRGVLHKD